MTLPAWPILQAPWLWPRRAQHGLYAVLALLSGVLCAVWQDERAEVQQQRVQQAQHQHNLRNLRSVQDNTRAVLKALAEAKHADDAQLAPPSPEASTRTTGSASSQSMPATMQALKQQAEVFQLQLSELTLQQAQTGPLLQFEVQGRYASVWSWWQQVQAPFWVAQQFEMESTHDQTRLRATWRWLPPANRNGSDTHSIKGSSNTGNSSGNNKDNNKDNNKSTDGNKSNISTSTPADVTQRVPAATPHIGFDPAVWRQVQRWHAQQSPSYVQWVVPLLRHAPQVLEQFSLQQLRYEGSLVQANRRLAVVRVLNDAHPAEPLALLQEGAFLGPDLGQLLAITPEHLWVREVARNAQGEWAPRWVKLPLGRALPAPQGNKHTP